MDDYRAQGPLWAMERGSEGLVRYRFMVRYLPGRASSEPERHRLSDALSNLLSQNRWLVVEMRIVKRSA